MWINQCSLSVIILCAFDEGSDVDTENLVLPEMSLLTVAVADVKDR